MLAPERFLRTQRENPRLVTQKYCHQFLWLYFRKNLESRFVANFLKKNGAFLKKYKPIELVQTIQQIF